MLTTELFMHHGEVEGSGCNCGIFACEGGVLTVPDWTCFGVRCLEQDAVDQPWSWETSLEEAVDHVNSYDASRTSPEEVAGCAHAAFQGYRALMVSTVHVANSVACHLYFTYVTFVLLPSPYNGRSAAGDEKRSFHDKWNRFHSLTMFGGRQRK